MRRLLDLKPPPSDARGNKSFSVEVFLIRETTQAYVTDFRSDENAGESLGGAVADFVVDNFLTRVHRRDGEGDKEGSDD